MITNDVSKASHDGIPACVMCWLHITGYEIELPKKRSCKASHVKRLRELPPVLTTEKILVTFEKEYDIDHY